VATHFPALIPSSLVFFPAFIDRACLWFCLIMERMLRVLANPVRLACRVDFRVCSIARNPRQRETHQQSLSRFFTNISTACTQESVGPWNMFTQRSRRRRGCHHCLSRGNGSARVPVSTSPDASCISPVISSSQAVPLQPPRPLFNPGFPGHFALAIPHHLPWPL
jgi:hypothetical protein